LTPESHPQGSRIDHRSDLFWIIINSLSAIGTGYLYLQNDSTPIRPVLSVWFIAVCPGMALVRLMHFNNPLVNWSLGVALSLGISMIVSEYLIYAGTWYPNQGLAVLILVCLAGTISQVVQWGLKRKHDIHSE
jgi:hypothetical protein